MDARNEHVCSTEIASYSANFDHRTFTLLMQRLAATWPQIFTAPHVTEISVFYDSLKRDEYRPFSLAVEHAGEIKSLGIVGFDDGTGLLELDFFSFPELIANIEPEHERVCEEQDIVPSRMRAWACVQSPPE